jgi:hypothetical protein
MNEQDITQAAAHTSLSAFRFVTNISHDGPDKISFWVGDIDTYVKLNRTWNQKLKAAFTPALLVMSGLAAMVYDLYLGIFLLIIFIPVIILTSWQQFGLTRHPFTQVRLHYDRALSRLTIEGACFGRQYSQPYGSFYIDSPCEVNVVQRFFPGDSGVRMITLDILGARSTDKTHELDDNCVVGYTYVDISVPHRLDQVTDAFEFLALWLNAPLIIVPYEMFHHTRTRNMGAFEKLT